MVHRVVGVMIASFSVLSLMVDDRAIYLHLTRREVSLKVLHIGGRIPKTPFHEREKLHLLDFLTRVVQRHLLYLSPSLQGDKKQQLHLQIIFSTSNSSISHTMATLIAIEFGFARFPAGTPDTASFTNVEVPSSTIHWHIVVTIANDSSEFCIFIESIPPCCVGNKTEEIFVAQVIDPGPGGAGICYHIFSPYIIEITVL